MSSTLCRWGSNLSSVLEIFDRNKLLDILKEKQSQLNSDHLSLISGIETFVDVMALLRICSSNHHTV